MTAREIYLEGLSPWGFRMNGGADVGHPLRISRPLRMVRVVNISEAHVHLHYSVRRFRDRLVKHIEERDPSKLVVNPESKAALKGIREGDLITSINGQSTKCLTNSESHALLRTVKENLRLGLNEDKNVSPKRRSRDISRQTSANSDKDSQAINGSSSSSKGNDPKADEKVSSSKSRRQRRTKLKSRLKQIFGLGKSDEDLVFEPTGEELENETESEPPFSGRIEKAEAIDAPKNDTSLISSRANSPRDEREAFVGRVVVEEVIYDNCGSVPLPQEHRDASPKQVKVERPENYCLSSQANYVTVDEGEDVWELDETLKRIMDCGSAIRSMETSYTTSEKKGVEMKGGALTETRPDVCSVVSRDEGKNDNYYDVSFPPEEDDSEIFHRRKTYRDKPKIEEVKIIVHGPEECKIENVPESTGGSGNNESDELLKENIQFLPPNDVSQLCNAAIRVHDENKYSLSSDDIHNPLIPLEEEEKLRCFLETLELTGSDGSVQKKQGKPQTCPYPQHPQQTSQNIQHMHYLPVCRYLEAISEENSDLSDGDRPWENSELIKQNNDIEGIPEDWRHSQDGIDTSWQDGKSLEEVSDVQIISDSPSDTDILMDDPGRDRDPKELPRQTKKESKPPFKYTVTKVKENIYANIPPFASNPKEVKNEPSNKDEKNNPKPVPSVDVVKNVVSSYYNTKYKLLESIRILKEPDKVPENKVQEEQCKVKSSKVPNIIEDIELVYIDSSDSEVTSVKSEIACEKSDVRPESNNEEEGTNEINELPNKKSSPEMIDSSGTVKNKKDRSNTTVEDRRTESFTEVHNTVFETPQTQDHDDETMELSGKDSYCVERRQSTEGNFYRHLSKDTPSVSTQSLPEGSLNSVCSLRDLSTNIIISLPCGSIMLKELGITHKELSDSDYCLGTSEYSFSSGTNLASMGDLNKSFNDLGDEKQRHDQEDSSTSSGFVYISESVHREQKEFESDKKWVGMPLINNPRMLLCVSPAQSKQIAPDPHLASDLLDLHKKFIHRRGYHENSTRPKSNCSEPDLISIDFNQKKDAHAYTPEILFQAEYLLAMKQRQENEQNLSENKIINPLLIDEWSVKSAKNSSEQNKHSEKEVVSKEKDFINKSDDQEIRQENWNVLDSIHVQDVKRIKRIDEFLHDESKTESVQRVSNSRLLELIQCVEGESSPSVEDSMDLTRPVISRSVARNAKPEEETSVVEDRKATVLGKTDSLKLDQSNMDSNNNTNDEADMKESEKENQRYFDAVKYRISKKGDIAIYENSSPPDTSIKDNTMRPKSLPPSGEIFRQQMYQEYMDKVAERTERRQQKVIKLSNVQSSSVTSDAQQIESEFMEKVKERMLKLGIQLDEEEKEVNDPKEEEVETLPKHLQELMDIMEDGGVWSPAQTPETERKKYEFPIKSEKKEEEKEDKNEDPQPPVWTPPSAGASPTLERKFRSINFQSPPTKRKEFKTSEDHTELPKTLPVETTFETKSRLVTSTSENSTLSSQLRLPSAQNPTITLLQKAREGQLPKGAQYLESRSEQSLENTLQGTSEIVYAIKKEYKSDSEENPKRILEVSPRKFEGIGPVTRDGTPIALRSEVKEDNHQKWYKRMYDSLHKAEQDKDYVTVRYSTKRKGHYPYVSAGGYLSEPERLNYDSDASVSKYATLDRRRIRNKENDFTTSTMPRSRYTSAVRHAVDVYKNQPGRIEDYEPGHSSISEKETKQWWDEVMDIFDEGFNKESKSAKIPTGIGRKSFTYAFKEPGGYESDSTLVFRRRDSNMDGQLMSPADQKSAYKVIQKGGEVPLHGLRKPAPERPKEDTEIEYFPISPTLTRIRIHKTMVKPQEDVYYPSHPVFSTYKRTARSMAAPSPPKRRSSKNNSTLKFYSKIVSKPLEASTENIKTRPVGKSSPKVNVEKCYKSEKNVKTRVEPEKKKAVKSSQYGVVRPRGDLLNKSPDLKAPAEVRKVLQETKTPSGTIVKSSTTLYSSARNKKPKEDKSLKVTVAISSKGREVLRTSSRASSKSDLRKSPSPLLSKSSSTESKTSQDKSLNRGTTSVLPKVSKPSSKANVISAISIDHMKRMKKESPIIEKKKREKKPEVVIKSSTRKEKVKEEEKKKIKKRTENVKKKNGIKKKDKENVSSGKVENYFEQEQFGYEDTIPIKSDKFFQNLLLRDLPHSSPPPAPVTTVHRSYSVAERAKKLTELQNSYYKSEPSLRNLNVYLSQKRPVSESRFRSLERDSHVQSPYFSTYEFYEKLDGYDKLSNVWEYSQSYQETPTYESVKERSSSEPPRTSPASDDIYENLENVSPAASRSPSCRRIRRSTSRTIESISGVKRKFRSKSLNEADRQSQLGSTSSLTLSQTTDHADYQTYILERLHSSRKSARFKELHKFYSSLERMAELQKATSNSDLRPRLKGEEIIDFDRWKQIRNKERAEVELNNLYQQLKEDQREKDLLFKPKETVRWKGDRGLRSKEKSVEDLRLKFQRMAENDLAFDDLSKQQMSLPKDVYKPLWRGNSVANLAYSLTSVTGSKRGRPVVENNQSLTKPTVKQSSSIGSRLWSSLSMEQVNALKNQLSEIYSTVSNLKHERIQKMRRNLQDYEINVSEFGSQEALHVRCNSLISDSQLYSPSTKRRQAKRQECMKADSISTLPSWKSQLPMSEGEKKKLSMSISAEIKDRVKKKKHGSLVIPRETLGAVAAIKGTKKQKSPSNSEISPRTCYSLLSDDLVDNPSEKNKDFLLVLTPKDKQNEVKKIVDNWGGKEYAKVVQTTSSSSSSASTVIHLGSKDDFKSSDVKTSDTKPEISQSTSDVMKGTSSPVTFTAYSRPLFPSQSYSDLKELFGEKQATTYATLPLKNVRKHISNSAESLCKSTSPDPMKYYKAYLSVVKAGDVRKLREKFESYDDIYNFLHAVQNMESDSTNKRFQSDPDLTRDYLSRKGGELSRVTVKGQEFGDVQWLRRRYEPRKLSPTPFKLEDRYMPRINVISKTASLQRRSRTAPPKLETSKTGNVERLKQFFERQDVSILGQMYTSTPEITELRDIAPYLECDWIAHKNPLGLQAKKKNIKPRPSSVSPTRQSILKHPDIFSNQHFDPEIHRPLYRYQPEYDSRWQHRSWSFRPTVTFKEPLGNPLPTPPREHYSRQSLHRQESPHRYLESEVNIHYRSPIRTEAKAAWPEEELAQKQAEVMRRIYQEQRRTKYLNELQDMYSRRHTDNFIPSQKSPIPLNRYDDFPVETQPPRPRDRTPEPKLVARALYNFIGQTSRELSFRRGDIIFVRRQIDKNWYEGEHNAMIGLFPFNYVEIIPYDGIRTLPKKSTEGQARAKFNFQAQTHLELSLVKGELVLLTRRVDENWFEGRIGNRKGIFPVSYVEVLVEPGEKSVSPTGPMTNKPLVAPASHSVMLNGAKDMGQQHYQPPRPAIYSSASLPGKHKLNEISLVSQALHIDTRSDPVPYRVLYNYKPQNDDELELREGDIVYVMEKCDDGWYVGSLHRNGQFGTFPGNYVERIQ